MRPSLVQRAGGACLVLSGVVTLLFAMSLGAYAQAEEVAVRWMIEGQSERQPDYEAGTNPDGEGGRGTGDGSGDGSGVIVMIESLPADPGGASPMDTPEAGYDRFVTGNQYATGDHLISIFTEEGQILNQAIIDQKETQADNFRHKIKYYDRFSDGYVEIAEALLDPLGEQTYFIRGSMSDRHPSSNLDLFVLERGYSLDNLQAVPNYIFSPMEFTYGRALLEDVSGTGDVAGDLRAYSPNYMAFNEAELQSRMTESFSAQATEVLERILFAPTGPEPEPELYTLNPLQPAPGDPAEEVLQPIAPLQPAPGDPAEEVLQPIAPLQGVFDAILPVQPRFEDAGRVGSAVENRVDVPPSSQPQPQQQHLTVSQDLSSQYVTLLIVLAAAGLAALGYVAYGMRRGQAPVVPQLPAGAVTPEPVADYRTATKRLLSAARALYDTGCRKEAHEMLGRAIRLFYSRRMGARGLLTNEELLLHMRHGQASDISEYKSVAKWLVVCGSVEYAKYRPDAGKFAGAFEDFSNMVDR